MSIYRLTGPVTEIGAKRGISKKSGEPYEIPFAVISLGDFVHNQVNISDSMVGKLSVGEVADVMVDVSTVGGYTNATVLRPWPADLASAPSATRARPLASTGS